MWVKSIAKSTVWKPETSNIAAEWPSSIHKEAWIVAWLRFARILYDWALIARLKSSSKKCCFWARQGNSQTGLEEDSIYIEFRDYQGNSLILIPTEDGFPMTYWSGRLSVSHRVGEKTSGSTGHYWSPGYPGLTPQTSFTEGMHRTFPIV